MSAWMHDTDHIDLIISIARHLGTPFQHTPDTDPIDPTTDDGATTLGRILLDANAESVIYRYGLDEPDQDTKAHAEAKRYRKTATTYTFRPVDLDTEAPAWNLGGGTAAVASCMYQSDTRHEWHGSAAEHLCHQIRDALPTVPKSDSPFVRGVNYWCWERPQHQTRTTASGKKASK